MLSPALAGFDNLHRTFNPRSRAGLYAVAVFDG